MAEVEFRTGKREIPDHLADLMAGLETHRMTFDEAVDAANKRLLGDTVDKAFDRVIKNHFTLGLPR